VLCFSLLPADGVRQGKSLLWDQEPRLLSKQTGKTKPQKATGFWKMRRKANADATVF
jgi:hypothetical protein